VCVRARVRVRAWIYVNIEICIYHIVLKNQNIIQLYLYNINMCFRLSLDKFQVGLNNIHIRYPLDKITIQEILIHPHWLHILGGQKFINKFMINLLS